MKWDRRFLSGPACRVFLEKFGSIHTTMNEIRYTKFVILKLHFSKLIRREREKMIWWSERCRAIRKEDLCVAGELCGCRVSASTDTLRSRNGSCIFNSLMNERMQIALWNRFEGALKRAPISTTSGGSDSRERLKWPSWLDSRALSVCYPDFYPDFYPNFINLS